MFKGEMWPHGVCLWKCIRSGCGNFSRFIRYEVGSGVNICFWHDWWYKEGVLKEAFTELYVLAQFKEASVQL